MPWSWVPTLYFAEGLPYVVAMTVSVIMYKRMGISNTDIALYTSWLYLPWVIKPLWSPLVDMFLTKRFWILVMQPAIGLTLAAVALTLPLEGFLKYSLICLWILAFCSATHDIAADGFYMLGLSKHDQAFYVGIRNMFYRFAMLAGQGLIVVLAGFLESRTGQIATSWKLTFLLLSGLFFIFSAYHFFVLPRPGEDTRLQTPGTGQILKTFLGTFLSFFRKKRVVTALLFLLFFRLAEAQLVKMASPFMLDVKEKGGLALTTTDVGFVYGTAGIIALTLGGILGGIAIARKGLKKWLWGMTIAINLPNLVYVYLSYTQPSSLGLITSCVVLEQFGYGFGFTAYVLFMMYFSDGPSKTAHYAI